MTLYKLIHVQSGREGTCKPYNRKIHQQLCNQTLIIAKHVVEVEVVRNPATFEVSQSNVNYIYHIDCFSL